MSDGAHSCGPHCMRPLCVANRRIRELEIENRNLVRIAGERADDVMTTKAENVRLRQAFVIAPCERDGVQALCDDCDCWKRAALEGEKR